MTLIKTIEGFFLRNLAETVTIQNAYPCERYYEAGRKLCQGDIQEHLALPSFGRRERKKKEPVAACFLPCIHHSFGSLRIKEVNRKCKHLFTTCVQADE
jgi:hypothetical protein